MCSESMIRVRFAPSPTGYLHIGGARTAIFNWLFARNKNGKFLLRIEDTDISRSDPRMVQAIFDSLKWLGLDWDEEPIYQSNRNERYREVCQQLIKSNKAYYCYCSQERLAETRKDDYRYDGHCRNLSPDEIENFEKQKIPRVIRFKVEEGFTYYKDSVYGSLKIENSEIDDFVILRSNNTPTYQLAVVVDDHDMQITDVIRGDDHLSNTPKQIMIYKALNWSLPNFAHVPLILGSDNKRLSKRHGATSVTEYKEYGFLSDSMVNFLALLGWSPKGNQEIFSKEELVRFFDLKGISKKSAVFDEKKLEWMNGEYISKMDDELLYNEVSSFLTKQNLNLQEFDKEYIVKAISLLKSRIKKINDFYNLGFYFFNDPENYDPQAVHKHWNSDEVSFHLKSIYAKLENITDFGEESTEKVIRNLADEFGIGAGKLIHPLRLALTGYAVSPGIFELISLLGKNTVLKRIDNAIKWLNK